MPDGGLALHQHQGEEYEADGSCCSNEEIGIHSTHQDMQLTIPSEPAMAVRMAINTLSNLLQLTCFDMRFWFLGLINYENEDENENWAPRRLPFGWFTFF